MAGRLLTNESASIYEDFQPQVERKEEQGANILLIHLPGFPKEQIRITYVESYRTIKVQGERALEKNRRSRLNQSFPVPQNCIIEKILGSFRNGVLTVTMPKQTIAHVGSIKDANTTKETTPSKAMSPQKPMKDQNKTTTMLKAAASTSGVEKERDKKLLPPQTPQKAITEPKAPTEMGPQQNATPKAAQTNGNKVDALLPLKQQEETQKKAAPIATTAKQTEEKTGAGSTSTAEIVEKKDESKVVKEKESGKTKDSTMYEINIPKILEKGKNDDKAGGPVEEKPKERGSSFLEKAKEMKVMDTIMKTAKRLATDDYEDRMLLINIGVSVLVIAALGAYITYSYRSSGKAKD
ncbi:inactive protein RESTRICTED TEV MOVEMENT 2-like [Durio zibethinus]|uniref:Inactive protein RESTRICTED TEV MOVEMENT 2-like n=1 Tax=Durio zibethinus TaxID=66656 RepID=A0A6P6ABL4_DURZI|nr:inactive protein RESTRICTED TEV MOVEMENT 2-like [Durio zibethinus]